MKAKVLLTGEIVDVSYIGQLGTGMTNMYKDSFNRTYAEYELEFLTEEYKLEFLTEELLDNKKHWQDVRERAAIAAMQGMLSCGEGAFHYDGVTDKIAKSAVEQADALVKQLKGE